MPPPKERFSLDDLAGNDPTMQRNVRSVRRIAASSVSVMIQGATGTGKEMLARALHDESGRAPFVALNCAAIPESLIESELFGYQAGAFTGARRDGAKGIILQSSGGTLFLDEIGDMPAAAADPAAARPRGMRGLAAGCRASYQGGSARGLRLAPEPAQHDRPRSVSRRSLLPAQWL